MKSKFVFIILLLICFVFLNLYFFKKPASAQVTIGKLSAFKGDVKLVRRGLPISLTLNMPVLSGDKIKTKKGEAEVRFLDGSLVNIGNYSDITLEQVKKKRYILGTWSRPYLARIIKVNKGKIKGNIKARKDLITEFEKPHFSSFIRFLLYSPLASYHLTTTSFGQSRLVAITLYLSFKSISSSPNSLGWYGLLTTISLNA